MTRVANQFVDPKGALPTYPWPINHDSMDPSGRKRTTTAVAPTGGIGTIRQQGNDTPLTLTLKGTILTEAQRDAMITWWNLCKTQTIWFYEFSGEQYEVLITDFEEVKVGVAYNNNDPTMPYHIFTYTLAMDVIQVLSVPVGWSGWINSYNYPFQTLG